MSRIAVTLGAGRRERISVMHRPRPVVERARLSYLESRGWVEDDGLYKGQYRTSYGDWWGEVSLQDGHLEYFIFEPPQEVLHGPHGPCFTHIGDNWWWVHFSKESPYPDDGVMAIAQTIEASLRC